MTTMTGTTTRRIQQQRNWERVAFLFMRLSGIALLILAVGHMMIQHVLNETANLSIQFVAEQWNDWGWKAYDMGLLAFAFAHGMNGLRAILGDYIHNRQTMKIITTILIVFVIVTIAWAGFAIFMFDPTAVPPAPTAG